MPLEGSSGRGGTDTARLTTESTKPAFNSDDSAIARAAAAVSSTIPRQAAAAPRAQGPNSATAAAAGVPTQTPSQAFGGGPATPSSPSSPSGGGGDNTPGGGGVAQTPATTTPEIDWADVFWGSLGLTPAMIATINAIFVQYASDPSAAQSIAQNYIYTYVDPSTGTNWMDETYVGFTQGLVAGLYSDFSGYQSYVNQLNVLQNQYYNANVTNQQVLNAINTGISPTIYGQQLQGQVITTANLPFWQQEAAAFGPTDTANTGITTNANAGLTAQQATAYGQQQAGLTSNLGSLVQQYMNRAVQRMQGVFKGQTGSISISGGPQGANVPGLLTQGRANPAANVGAT